MDFPHGRHSHSHHHRREGSEEDYPPPAFDGPRTPPPPYPPSFYGSSEPSPPPGTHVYHSSHHGIGGGGAYPAPDSDYYSQPPPPSQNFGFSGTQGHGCPPPQSDYYSTSTPSVVQHVSHDSPFESGIDTDPHHHRPHLPSFLHHNQHQGSELAGKPTVRVVTKANTGYSLTIRDGKVILAPSNPSDPFQHWFKDEKYSTRVKDEEGFPSFALVNKATGQAMKHSIGATQPVQLIPYNPDVLDESVLWTESKDLGDGHRTIRMVNNIRLNVDAFHGDKDHGGVHDGTTIVLWEWKKDANQRWNIIPY